MAWELKDGDLLDRVAATTAPPTDLLTLLSDDLWSNTFSMWATDLGFQRGDYNASNLHHLWADLNYGTPGETIRAQYVDPSGPSALPWQTGVLGDNHSSSYYEYLQATGHTVGTIMMMKRGGAFSPGRVEVGILDVIDAGGPSGVVRVVPSQDDIRQAVTDAIGRVSNKEVKHHK